MFSVLKYGRDNWSLNKTLIKRIDVFEQWCCRRILKISWKDKVSNRQVLHRIGEATFQENAVKQKLAHAGHVLRGSGGLNALLVWGSLMEKEQEAVPEGGGQMMLYGGCRRKSMMKLRDWLRTGTLGER